MEFLKVGGEKKGKTVLKCICRESNIKRAVKRGISATYITVREI